MSGRKETSSVLAVRWIGDRPPGEMEASLARRGIRIDGRARGLPATSSTIAGGGRKGSEDSGGSEAITIVHREARGAGGRAPELGAPPRGRWIWLAPKRVAEGLAIEAVRRGAYDVISRTETGWIERLGDRIEEL